MQLLLDSNILIALSRRELTETSRVGAALVDVENAAFVSVASLWEIAIKTRLRKLDPGRAPADLPGFCVTAGIELLSIDQRHVLADLDAEPATRDPFDRLLLAQCQVEGLRLVTTDRHLADHPLAWRE